MSCRETEHLRVLVANERKDRLALVAPIVVAQGHEVVAPAWTLRRFGSTTHSLVVPCSLSQPSSNPGSPGSKNAASGRTSSKPSTMPGR
jgi:hypothetical protein